MISIPKDWIDMVPKYYSMNLAIAAPNAFREGLQKIWFIIYAICLYLEAQANLPDERMKTFDELFPQGKLAVIGEPLELQDISRQLNGYVFRTDDRIFPQRHSPGLLERATNTFKMFNGALLVLTPDEVSAMVYIIRTQAILVNAWGLLNHAAKRAQILNGDAGIFRQLEFDIPGDFVVKQMGGI